MKKNHFPLIVSFAIILIGILSACSPTVPPSGWPGLTVSQNTAYLAAGSFVYAINLDNPSTALWRYPADKAVNGKTFYAAPELAQNNQLLVPSYETSNNSGKLYSLDQTTGTEKWYFPGAKSRYIASPLVTDTSIFAPNADGNLYALDFTGKQMWLFETKKPLWAKPAINATGDTLYLAGMDHKVYAISAASGAQIWASSDLKGALVSTPTLGPDGTLYVGTFSNEMVAIDSKDGSIKWRVPTTGWVWSSPALENGTLYFGDMGGTFYALDASNGQQKWSIQPKNVIVSQPLVTTDTIIFTTDTGGVNAIDLNGKNLWSYPVASPAVVYAPVVMSGDLLLVTPSGGTNPLIALNPSGTLKWAFTPAK